MRRLGFLWACSALACARPLPPAASTPGLAPPTQRPPPPPAPASPPETASPPALEAASPPAPASPPDAITFKTFGGRKIPEVCRGKPTALDAAGRAALQTFERHLVDDVLRFPVRDPERYLEGHDDGSINPLEVGQTMREEGVTDVLFAFPVPVEIPASPYHVRTTGTVADLRFVDHPVFYVELSGAWMVRAGRQTGFVFEYAGGPAGKPPENTVWMWGTGGRMCAYRKPDGAWKTIPVGLTWVSSHPSLLDSRPFAS
jgi:hypothetical protein